MKYWLHILFIVFLSAFNMSAEGTGVVHNIGADVRPSYILPTHGFYNGYNPSGRPLRTGGSMHLGYSFSYSPDSRVGREFPGAYQGVGVGVQTFMAHEALGTPVMLYLFQGAPFARLSDYISLDYEWNLGLSAGWKPNEYLLTGSRQNVYINVGLFLTWRLDKAWDIRIGPEYTHFSNGDTVFPNGGANTFNFRVGARRYFNRKDNICSRPRVFELTEQKQDFRSALSYDIILYGSWRADRMSFNKKLYLINDKFLVAGLQFNPLYHLNHCLSFGPSLDLMYDRSADLIASEVVNNKLVYAYPSFDKQCAFGLSLRGELSMPIFSVNVGGGYNFTSGSDDLEGLYGIFMLKAFLSDSLFINVGYRLSAVLYSHNLMFGLGWRINRKESYN